MIYLILNLKSKKLDDYIHFCLKKNKYIFYLFIFLFIFIKLTINEIISIIIIIYNKTYFLFKSKTN